MCKIMGVKRLCEGLCPAPAFVPVDRDEARTHQHFIHSTVSNHNMTLHETDF